MGYGEDVLRLRKEVAALKRKLGEKTGSSNQDIFGVRPVGAHELETLQAEHRTLTGRLAVSGQRELDISEGRSKGWVSDTPPAKPAPKPDNRDILIYSKSEYEKHGGAS
jgi:hypothetical protein